MNTSCAVAIMLLGSVAACSGGSDNHNKTPDAFVIHDMAIDGRACGTATGDMHDFGTFIEGSFISWSGKMTGIGGATPVDYSFEFYDGIEPSLQGTFDLKAGNQANYSSCAVCVHAFVRDTQGKVIKHYFQSAGSITLSEDPFTNKHLIASVTGLQMEEVTVADQTFVSTPVPGGECASVADYTVDHDRVPNAWTCTHAEFDNAASCDCVCGTPDPDCWITTTPVVGCTTGEACFRDACVTPPANDTCATATAITIGTPVTGTTAGAKRNYSAGLDASACTGSLQPGPDVVYTVDLAAAQQITVTLSGLEPTYDGGVSLVGPGAAALCDAMPIATCVAGADDKFAGQTETFTYTAVTAGTYFVIVDGYTPEDGGAYTLGVTSP